MATGWRGEWPPACEAEMCWDAFMLLPGFVTQLQRAGCPSVQWAARRFPLDGLAERICPASGAEGALGSSGDLGWTLQVGWLNHNDGEHQWGTTWLLCESCLPSRAISRCL